MTVTMGLDMFLTRMTLFLKLLLSTQHRPLSGSRLILEPVNSLMNANSVFFSATFKSAKCFIWPIPPEYGPSQIFIKEETADLPVSTFSALHTSNLPVNTFLASLEKNFFAVMFVVLWLQLRPHSLRQVESSSGRSSKLETPTCFSGSLIFIDQNILLLFIIRNSSRETHILHPVKYLKENSLIYD